MADIVCPHCGMLIPVTGAGSKMVVIVKGRAQSKVKSTEPKPPKTTLQDILGERFDDYWKLAAIFGPTKNFRPSETAALYMQALASGVTVEQIFARATILKRLTEETKYLPQLAKWLEGQGYQIPEANQETTSAAQSNSRLSARQRSE